jgi:hypothetical protein
VRFGRVSGHVVARDNGLDLTVVLDSGQRVETIRSEHVDVLGSYDDHHDLAWQADQYTQETLGNELALLGWEAIAEEPAAPSPAGTGMSASYLVRRTV